MIDVALAYLFDSSGRVLVAQRPKSKTFGGMWEFPGGKIEGDETPEEAIQRELYEELRIFVNAEKVHSSYIFDLSKSQRLRFFPVSCSWKKQEIILIEHESCEFVDSLHLRQVTLAPPDYVAVDILLREVL